MTEPYNLKEAFDDLQKHLKMKECDLPSFLYKCKDWRISEDGNEVFYNLYNRDCSCKVYPSNEIGFRFKIVLKIDSREEIIHTGVDYHSTYVWEDGRCYHKHKGLLETAVLFSKE